MSFLQRLFHTHRPTPSKDLPATGQRTYRPYRRPIDDPQALVLEASSYLRQFEQECDVCDSSPGRLAEIKTEIHRFGTYWQTPDELAYGAKVAWRNNPRCIGRLHWKSLTVRDMRHVTTEEEVFAALIEHLRVATNGGKIRSTITIFAPAAPGEPGIRIWNPQLIRYAGYREADGSIIGDPANADLTDVIRTLGWKGGPGTPFDILPLVIQHPHRPPRLFEVPRDVVLEVPLAHPDYPWFVVLRDDYDR